MTVFLAGPTPRRPDHDLLDAISGRVFLLDFYGQPALLKLLNNTLATYNLASTARMLNSTDHLGIPAPTLLEVIGVSTGQSWMGDNIVDVQYDVLLKAIGLLQTVVESLPVGLDGTEHAVLEARNLLSCN